MAETLTVSELRRSLQSPDDIRKDPFSMLKAISNLVNSDEGESVGREMVLRALEWRSEFANWIEILDSLARATGLYPYADVESLDLRDRIAYEFHRPFNMGDSIVFHREQAEIYRR